MPGGLVHLDRGPAGCSVHGRWGCVDLGRSHTTLGLTRPVSAKSGLLKACRVAAVSLTRPAHDLGGKAAVEQGSSLRQCQSRPSHNTDSHDFRVLKFLNTLTLAKK